MEVVIHKCGGGFVNVVGDLCMQWEIYVCSGRFMHVARDLYINIMGGL